MDSAFKDWILADFAKLSGKEQEYFLRMLKFRPEELIYKISLVIMDYMPGYIAQTSRVCCCNITTDPRELVMALKAQFAERLEGITL